LIFRKRLNWLRNTEALNYIGNSYPVIEKLSEEENKTEKDTEKILSKNDITTIFTNQLAEVSTKSDDLSVFRYAEQINFKPLSAQLLQKAIEKDSSNVMNTSDCSIGTGLADSFFKISGQNADINNMLINMSKNYGKFSPQISSENKKDVSVENHSDLTDVNMAENISNQN